MLLLYYFINDQKTILRDFAKELKASNKNQAEILKALTQITQAMSVFDERLQALEKKEVE